ncbi:zinc finger protein 91-like isoform X1 [Pieris napi]|uniref:zinc finger protein 91-like isoform X1 n=2 Tax=Pieris napi TaxID=78633 RepID=UPI001FB93E9A|nr:zinc finger protein 91-like isoform X1 [Pieris napi]
MADVKMNISFRKGVCNGCLSLDRVTSSIEKQDLFIMLLSKETQYMEPKYLSIQLCWECKSMLRKISLFQQKICEAQYILQNSISLDHNTFISTTISLSTLSTIYNPEFDYIISHDEAEKETLNLPEPLVVDTIKEEIEVFPDTLNDNDYDNDFDSNDYMNNCDVNDVKNESNIDNRKDVQSKEKQKQCGKFERRAIVTPFDIDLKSPQKYYDEVNVSNNEILKILDKERSSTKSVTKYRIKCECKNRFKKLLDMKRHMDIDHLKPNPPYNCSECSQMCESITELHSHWQTHNLLYKCMFCSQYLQNITEIKCHLMNHTKLYTCKKCAIQSHSSQLFREHYTKYHTKFICDYCEKVFHCKRLLEKHIVKTHFPSICQVCNRMFSKYHSLEVHYRNFHPELIYKTVKRELSYCVECDRQFPSQYVYKRHLKTAAAHVQKKSIKIPCPECGKVFSRKAYMKNHYKLVHVRSSSHYCEICSKHFISGFSLRTHRKFVHEKTAKPKDKICDVCGRGFHTNRTLINHTRTHTGERPYKCSYCPAAFAQSYARKTHERSQHKHLSDAIIIYS